MNRIKTELKELIEDPPLNVSAAPIDDSNLYIWEATIIGPEDSPYSGGIFNLSIESSKQLAKSFYELGGGYRHRHRHRHRHRRTKKQRKRKKRFTLKY